MPRTRKTLSGQDAQPVGAVAGQMYGMGEEQMALQRAMPAPQAGSAPPAAPAVSPSSPRSSAAPPVGMDKAQLFELAKGLRDKMGMLTAPTGRPREPVTAGLSGGPGPGPEILQMPRGNPVGETMRRLAISTGDSYLQELADRAGL